jgi:hypothetical protein
MDYALAERDGGQYRKRVMTASGIDVVAGIWLILSPFVLAIAGEAARWNAIALGAAVTALAGTRVLGAYRAAGLSWINVMLGIWLIISPWPLGGFEDPAIFWNSVMAGIVIATCASWSALSSPPPEI